MKTWFYAHPNISFVLLLAAYMYLVSLVAYYLHNRQWGWAALALVAATGVYVDVRSWWRNQL